MKKILIFFIICVGLPSCTDFSAKVENFVSERYGDADSSSVYEIDLQDILEGKIGTARDVGNFAAGYLSGVHGIPLLFTRIAFDCLQKGIEPPVSRSAQNIGYFTGYYKYLIQHNHDTK